MSWWDDFTNAVTTQVSRAETAAGNTANWIGSGISNPGDALNSAWQQISTAPSYFDALNHGFTSVQAYQDYLAKQPQSNNYYGTGNPTADAILNTVGGIGVHTGSTGTGVGMGPTAGSTIPHTADQVTNAITQGQQNYNNPAPAPTDAQVNPAMGDAYKTQMGPPTTNLGYYAQDGQTANGLVWSSGLGKWVSPTEYTAYKSQTTLPASTTPVGSSTADLRVGDHRTYNGVYQTWNGTSWNNGSSAAAPGDPAGSAPLAQTQGLSGQVSTATQNPLMTPEQWQAKVDAIQAKYHDPNFLTSYSPADRDRDIAALGPQPTANPTNPALPAAPSTTPTPYVAAPPPGTPGVSTAPTGRPNPAGAAAGGLTAAGLGSILGIDPNLAAMLLATGGSALTTYLAAHEQSKAASDAATTQATAAAAAAAAQEREFNAALGQNKTQFDTSMAAQKAASDQAQANIKPWLDAGSAALPKLSNFDANNPDFVAPTFNEQNWQDQGYSFRLKEGLDALQNSAAAKGMGMSGNTMKAINNYAQDSASQEYQNAFNRYSTDTANAFNRFQAQRGTKLNELQSLAGIGQTASQQANAAGANYANNVTSIGQNSSNAASGLYTGIGNAQAGGITGTANAQAGGITGAANANASGWVGAGNLLSNALSQWMNYNTSQQYLGLQNALINARK